MRKKIAMLLPTPVKNAINKSKLTNTPKHTSPLQPAKQTLNSLIAYNHYGGYCLPVSAKYRPAAQKILKGEIYEPDTIAFMRKNGVGGDIVHAGTFFGDFLPGLSKGMTEETKIWAFEPNTESYRCAQITILINELTNVMLHNNGLGDAESVQKMLVQNEKGISLGGGSKIINQNEKGTTINIHIVSIDSIVPVDRTVSIIQLDVEGYEKQALQGAMNTIKRDKPILILEDNNHVIESKWFVTNILSLGYEVTKTIHNNTVLQAKTA